MQRDKDIEEELDHGHQDTFKVVVNKTLTVSVERLVQQSGASGHTRLC